MENHGSENAGRRAGACGIAERACRLAACALALCAAAIAHNGRLFGHAVARAPESGEEAAAKSDALVVDSTTLGVDVIGYGGPVPVVVRVEDGLVASVEPKLPNDETPMFFDLLEEDGLWRAWDGLPPDVAATTRVDAVASATYSSGAAIANARAAFAAASAKLAPAAASGGAAVSSIAETSGAAPAGVPAAAPVARPEPSPRTIAALAVLLAAAVVPLFVKSRRWRTAQLWLDVVVLGFWSGTFLSTARLLGWTGSGIGRGPAELATAALLLSTAFLWPTLLGSRSHYCLNVCPYGAAQELASRVPVTKWRLSPALVRGLSAFRRVLWIVLMCMLVCGIFSGWLGWELFGAFAWRAAPPLVLVFAALFVALSAFVPRPYCRFVCPTGALLGIAG